MTDRDRTARFPPATWPPKREGPDSSPPHLELEMDEWGRGGVQTEHISFIDEEEPPL